MLFLLSWHLEFETNALYSLVLHIQVAEIIRDIMLFDLLMSCSLIVSIAISLFSVTKNLHNTTIAQHFQDLMSVCI